jgi:hypothetical protein
MQKVAEIIIDGSFNGWTGRGAYSLVNGQVWKQIHYKYSYHYAYRPKAIIWRDGGRYLLEVDGMKDMIEVRRA